MREFIEVEKLSRWNSTWGWTWSLADLEEFVSQIKEAVPQEHHATIEINFRTEPGYEGDAEIHADISYDSKDTKNEAEESDSPDPKKLREQFFSDLSKIKVEYQWGKTLKHFGLVNNEQAKILDAMPQEEAFFAAGEIILQSSSGFQVAGKK